jgi:signal transduction histidine kinase/CheY-like chemotaxis protein
MADAEVPEARTPPRGDPLALLRRLLAAPADGEGLASLLKDVAESFAAPAAGLAALSDGRPVLRHGDGVAVLPWDTDPDLIRQARQTPTSRVVPLTVGSLLLTVVAPGESSGWLLWLEDPHRTTWDETAADLTLVGLVLGRRPAGRGPRWVAHLERLARQQALEQAAIVVRRLAHDFGNVLTGILGFCELSLSQPLPASSHLHAYLTEVLHGAQNGAQLTHLLRLFARRQALDPRPSSLAPVLVEEAAPPLIGSGATALRVEVAADLPPVALDAEHLRQVLRALLTNAREAARSPAGVVVTARVRRLGVDDALDFYGDVRPGDHIEVTVTDDGPGLSEEASQRLFVEPFYTTKPRRQGFGLAVSYGILHAHRGGLLLSNGPAGGAVARCVIPLGNGLVPPTPPLATEAGRGEKVLVVDDDPLVLQLVRTTLERAGYRVQSALSAEDALRSYADAVADPFRLVVSDVAMPRIDGIELAVRLRRRDHEARVLFISGQEVVDDRMPRDLPGRPIDLLPKPFRPEGLLRAVRSALSAGPERVAVR